MNIKLLFILILLCFNFNTYCDCEDIAESIETCKKYSCTRFINDGNSIEHKILGLNSENLCVYIEKQGDDEMVCHHSHDGMIIEKKYFESIARQEIDDLIDVAKIRAEECFFINGSKSNDKDQDSVMKEAIDFEASPEYSDIKSIFFDEEPINRMIHEMEQFNLRSSRVVVEEILDDFDCKVVSLDSILYLSPDTWKIWVNGKLFINTRDLKIHSVTEDYATFIWAVDQQVVKKQISNPKNIYFERESIMFTLYPKQKFDLESLSIT
ncbi:hypothetical protein [Wolbachia endosymbiont of Ctenocephalides felis wCfeT]|uniref:hypothetical protein n=1 Tax=Wolbachia endosymbiont of Ctenocephalides felis wCfeT TaxID=2732593 RepID=UPI001446EED4|nr:hypothetical protein [Wolbachia endosymbiont of Ctenocephalides felis wCfeT]